MAGGSDVIVVGDQDFQQQVLQSREPVLVDFGATWCAPCRAIEPHVADVATRYKGKLRVASVNVDDNVDTAQQYGVRSLPTLLFFKDGKVVQQIIGAVPRAKLEAAISKVV